MTTAEWQKFRGKCERYYKDVYDHNSTIKKGSVLYKSIKTFKKSDHICQPQNKGTDAAKLCKKANCPKLKYCLV